MNVWNTDRRYLFVHSSVIVAGTVQYRQIMSVGKIVGESIIPVARGRRRGDRPPTKNKCKKDGGYIYLVNVGRQGLRYFLAVKNGVGVAT